MGIIIVVDKSGCRALNHLYMYLINFTLRVKVPYTTGKLQFGEYKSKISGVLDLRSTTRSVQEDQDLNLPSYKVYHDVHSRTNCQQIDYPQAR